MKRHRWHHPSSIAVIAVLAACTAAPPSAVPEPSNQAGTSTSRPSTVASDAGPVVPTSATPSPDSGPLGGGPLIVFQLDEVFPEKAKAENVLRLDLGTGEQVKLGSLPMATPDCCPEKVRLSRDRSRAFLFGGAYYAALDVDGGAITRVPKRIAREVLAPSNRGDRLAWVDDVTGKAETIVIGNLKGKELGRLALPTGSWYTTTLIWSPDDSSLAVSTHRPLTAAMAGLGSSIIPCCSVDHGISPTHLLVVPVDGSPIRDLLDDTDGVVKDEAEPFQTPPPGVKLGGPRKAERTLEPAAWSPDGRTILLTTTICAATYTWHLRGACSGSLSIVDAETGRQTSLLERADGIFGAEWSPDGRQVAFTAGSGDEDTGLFVIDLDGRKTRRLTDAYGGLVDWSPDGTWLTFMRLAAAETSDVWRDRMDVWAVPVAGGAARLVAEHATAAW
ncbi:MAG: hypothetical protein ABJC39_07165 [Chloroflexota bacterium]